MLKTADRLWQVLSMYIYKKNILISQPKYQILLDIVIYFL